MELPWWIWVAVGIPVLIISSIAGIWVFIVVGFVFTVVGVAKLVYVFVLAPRVVERERVVHEKTAVNRRYCPRCFLSIPSAENKCRICGFRLK